MLTSFHFPVPEGLGWGRRDTGGLSGEPAPAGPGVPACVHGPSEKLHQMPGVQRGTELMRSLPSQSPLDGGRGEGDQIHSDE